MAIWERLDLHIENLVPGLALLAVWQSFPHAVGLGAPKDVSVLVAVLLLGLCYMLGVLANVVGRLVIDPPSKFLGPRPFLILCLAHTEIARRGIAGTLAHIKQSFNGGIEKGFVGIKDRFASINDAYLDTLARALSSGNTVITNEVEKRRQTARLVRASFPASALACHLWLGWGAAFWLLLAAVWAGTVAIYAYAEVTIFTEASHAFEYWE